MAKICKLLRWDSDFFGVRIARLLPSKLTDRILKTAAGWCGKNRIRCLYFLADQGDPQTALLAEGDGFDLVDVRVLLRRDLGGIKRDKFNNRGVRPARPSDIPLLEKIAGEVHLAGRFYHDSHFSKKQAGDFYKKWIERSCEGYADSVFVKEAGKKAVGYVTCHLAGKGLGRIGLFGVAADMRGKGAGRDLMGSALEWFLAKKSVRVEVVTQGRNIASRRFYEKNGFTIASVGFWYHKWFEESKRS